MDEDLTVRARRNITLRKGTHADLDTIMEHRRLMMLDIGYKEDAAFAAMLANSRSFLAERLSDGRYHAWFIQDGTGRVLAGGGLVIVELLPTVRDPSPRRPVIVNMYTEPASRRKGLARMLMQTMVDWCRSEGFNTVLLHASKDGRPLYEQLDFKPTNEMRLMLRQG